MELADWTVDKLLGFMRDVNAKSAREQSALAVNRTQFRNLQAKVAQIPDPARKKLLKDRLTAWIHRQVELENRSRDFAVKWLMAKNAVKKFLQTVGVTPPEYLSGLGVAQVGIVPLAIVALAIAASVAVGYLARGNQAQAQGLSAMDDIVGLVGSGRITPEQAKALMDEVKQAAEQKDPLGIANALTAAVPVGLLVLAIMLLPQITGRRAKAAA
jgi:hypothetical protein